MCSSVDDSSGGQYKSIYFTAILTSLIQAAYSVWWAFTVAAGMLAPA